MFMTEHVHRGQRSTSYTFLTGCHVGLSDLEHTGPARLANELQISPSLHPYNSGSDITASQTSLYDASNTPINKPRLPAQLGGTTFNPSTWVKEIVEPKIVRPRKARADRNC